MERSSTGWKRSATNNIGADFTIRLRSSYMAWQSEDRVLREEV